MQDRFWKIIKKSCQMHRKVEENLANIEKPSSIYGTVEDMVNRAGVGRGETFGQGYGKEPGLLPIGRDIKVFPVFIRNFADYCMQEETIFEQLSAVRDSILPAASGAAAVISAGLLHQSWAIEDVRSQNACIKDRIRLLHSGLL